MFNFIYFFDVSYMMLLVLEFDECGLMFVVVYDLFWIYVFDVDIMSDIIRDLFIRIYEEDVIGCLKCEFEVCFGDFVYFVIVVKNILVGKVIEDWWKVFCMIVC